MKRFLVCLAALVVTAESPAKHDARISKARPGDYLVTMTGDALEPRTVFSTGSPRGKATSFGGIFGTDATAWLSGFVNKTTGVPDYQIIFHVSYVGEWEFLDSANLPIGGSVKEVRAVIGRRDTEACLQVGCMHVEGIGIPLEEADIREIAASAAPLFRFRVKGSSGAQFDASISPAEAVALLTSMDSYRRTIK